MTKKLSGFSNTAGLPSVPEKSCDPVALRNDQSHEDWVSARVLALLGHFYDPPVDPMMRAVLLDDWFEAIGGLPKVAIENGCRDYLAAPNRYRPHPGAIRSLALKHMPPLPREPEPRDETPPPTTAARKRVQKLVEDLAKRI